MLAADSEKLPSWDESVDQLAECGRLFHDRGWSVGTSSNYSSVVTREPLELALTVSGKDKGRLGKEDFVRVGKDGKPIGETNLKSSAETMLHCVLADFGAGSILHTHSIWGTLLSDVCFAEGSVRIEGYEMLKGLAGIKTHDHGINVAIFENTQDIDALSVEVQERLHDKENPLLHGFLIRKHGLYTWGKDIAEARRHIEIFEFLFECVGRRMQFGS